MMSRAEGRLAAIGETGKKKAWLAISGGLCGIMRVLDLAREAY
jgi:hypothetical protein